MHTATRPTRRALRLGAVSAGLAASLLLVGATSATARKACATSTTVLESPRAGSQEVQAKALNDRGDVVGFADSNGGSGPIHAILWKGGKAAGAVDLGVLPGYVASEAYGVNNGRAVFGLLYDKQERTFPFRWQNGRMTVLKDPRGRVQQVAISDPSKNAINERGEIVATLIVAGHARAVRWSRSGHATFLPALPGHTWTWAFSISDDGVVSGWSRKQPKEHAVQNPVLWTSAAKVVPLKTARRRADGVANATNGNGLTVGLLGTEDGIESDQAAVWSTRASKPRLLGSSGPLAYAELFDVNDRGQAVGVAGTFNKTNGFPVVQPAIWQAGWDRLRTISVPAAFRTHPVVLAPLNDVNEHGTIAGNVYGLTGKDFSKVRRIDPVLWTCAFGA